MWRWGEQESLSEAALPHHLSGTEQNQARCPLPAPNQECLMMFQRGSVPQKGLRNLPLPNSHSADEKTRPEE